MDALIHKTFVAQAFVKGFDRVGQGAGVQLSQGFQLHAGGLGFFVERLQIGQQLALGGT